jgi:hypothetical protein
MLLEIGGMPMTAYRPLAFSIFLFAGLVAAPAFADPPGPGDVPDHPGASRPGAAALGEGTIFLTRTALEAPASGVLFISDGHALAKLEQPVGSCRLKVRVAGGKIASGTPLTVETVASSTSPYEDRGISTVTWHFAKQDPAESLFCDTVGNVGLAQGDVEAEVRGVLHVESSTPPPE